jgi:AmmeMemoRadiSam system protein B
MEALLAQRRRIRSPVCAGMFYPEDRQEIIDFMRSSGLQGGGGGFAQAIIAPHGAWSYSGALAANAFYSAIGRSECISRVVILGPIHDKRESGLFLSNSHSFGTPLGNIPVDRNISQKFEAASDFMEIDDIPHLGEHSIEILLPFVKYCFPHSHIVPILMGQPNAQYIHDLSRALKTVIKPIMEKTLIVVSCNLSCNNDCLTARSLAEECLRLFSEKNAHELCSSILNGRLNTCGGALAASLFESGLLDKTEAHYTLNNMVNAVDVENNTVYYNEVSFV